MNDGKRYKRLLRAVHAWIGLLASLNLLVIITTGFVIQQRDRFDLQDRYVSRRWLPSGYRPDDGPAVRSDIVVTDLHSGRVFGEAGSLILDVTTLAWSVLLVTGLAIFGFRYWQSGK